MIALTALALYNDFCESSRDPYLPQHSVFTAPRRSWLVLCRNLGLSVASHAIDPITVRDIRVEGLQRTDAGTVFNYLGIRVGDRFDDAAPSAAIKACLRPVSFATCASRFRTMSLSSRSSSDRPSPRLTSRAQRNSTRIR